MFYGWWIVVIAFFTSIFGAAVIWYGFTAYFSPLINAFGWSYTAISLAASFRGIEVGVLDIFVGFLIDRFGGRRIVFFGLMLIGVGYLALSRIHSLTTFYLAFFIVFIGASGISSVVFFQLMTRWFHKRLGLAIGLSSSGIGFGGFAVPGIVYLLDLLGFRMVFVIFGIMALAIGCIAGYFLRSRPEEMGFGPDGSPLSEHDKQVTEHSKAQGMSSTTRTKDLTFREAASDPTLWIVIYVSTVGAFATLLVVTHVMPYLEDIGYPRYMASIVAMMIPVTSIIGRLGVGWISDFVNHKVVFILSVIAQTIGIVLFFYARVYCSLVAFMILFGISYGGITVLRPAILRERYGSTYIGSLIGLCLGVAAIGSMAGPLLGGWVFDKTGSYELAWIISAILLVIGVVMIFFMKSSPPLAGGCRQLSESD